MNKDDPYVYDKMVAPVRDPKWAHAISTIVLSFDRNRKSKEFIVDHCVPGELLIAPVFRHFLV